MNQRSAIAQTLEDMNRKPERVQEPPMQMAGLDMRKLFDFLRGRQAPEVQSDNRPMGVRG